MNKLLASLALIIVVGCTSILISEPRDPSKMIYRIAQNGPFLESTASVCVKESGLFKKRCVEWQEQVVKKFDITLAPDRKEVSDRRIFCMSIDGLKMP